MRSFLGNPGDIVLKGKREAGRMEKKKGLRTRRYFFEARLNFFDRFSTFNQRRDAVGIKFKTGQPLQKMKRFVVRPRDFITPPAGEGVKDIGDGDYPRLNRNLFSSQTDGVARSIDRLVMVLGNVSEHLGAREAVKTEILENRINDAAADDDMRLHLLEFLLAQTLRFFQHRVGQTDFADIMQRREEKKVFDILIIKAIRRRQPLRD